MQVFARVVILIHECMSMGVVTCFPSAHTHFATENKEKALEDTRAECRSRTVWTGERWRRLNLSIQLFKNTLPPLALCVDESRLEHPQATRGHAEKVRCLRVDAKTVNGLVLVNLVQEQARGDQLHIVAQDEEENLHRTPEPSCKIPKRVWKKLGNPCSPLESHTTKRPSYPSRAEATASSQ